ncbi:MAG TPA: cell division protein SepF [Acidimicrobiales bacterium]|nr:cell division protein SepF [Acidimicrobiales bacterium]
MGRFQKAMSFLGLADDDYDEFEVYDEPIPSGPVRVGRTADPDPNGGGIRTLQRDEGVGVSPLPQSVVPRPVVRPVAAPKAAPTVQVVVVTEFSDGEDIGRYAKSGDFVIMNLQAVEPALARRLVDFASGVAYALDGKMERTARNVFLIRPKDVDVPDDEKARLAERGLYN